VASNIPRPLAQTLTSHPTGESNTNPGNPHTDRNTFGINQVNQAFLKVTKTGYFDNKIHEYLSFKLTVYLQCYFLWKNVYLKKLKNFATGSITAVDASTALLFAHTIPGVVIQLPKQQLQSLSLSLPFPLNNTCCCLFYILNQTVQRAISGILAKTYLNNG